jgi:hypothetical protein
MIGSLQTTKLGTNYASQRLSRTPRTSTHAFLFPQGDDVKLKVGRYWVTAGQADITNPTSTTPRSEISLTAAELGNLMRFLSDNVEPLKLGAKKYIALDKESDAELFTRLKARFEAFDVETLLATLEANDLLPADLVGALIHKDRSGAVKQFEEMLAEDLAEPKWQPWFQANDYLARAEDGHLDLIEIKRPRLGFWAASKDHGNFVPHSDLTKAITQANNYLFQLEREMDSIKSASRLGGIPIARPRALLIHGRSHDWEADHLQAQRLLNSSLATIQVLTYDQVLAKAKRIIGTPKGETVSISTVASVSPDECDAFADV